MAFCSLVYSSLPVPALTTLTLTLGYAFSKAAACSSACGVHDQYVISPPFSSAASTAPKPSWGASEEPPEPEPAQPARAIPAIAVIAAIAAKRRACALCVIAVSLSGEQDRVPRPRRVVIRQGAVPGYCLTLPALSPDCQNRCSRRNATMMGMIVRSDPMITRL